MMTNNEHIDYLLRQYTSNEASPEEISALFDWIRQSEHDGPLRDTMQLLWARYRPDEQLPAADWEAMYARIIHSHQSVAMPRKRIRWSQLAMAASITGLLVLGIWWWKKGASPKSITQQETGASIVAYTRHITLPDGSTVVLHANSQLIYPAAFTRNIREVSLAGEAYFDIVHREAQPFIIHTGHVKTTVLGTAFNIRAWANNPEVLVSVTRGRVRVENEQQMLAELTANQQITYNIQQTQTRQQEVNATRLVTDWTKKDMIFASIPFEQIAEVLSHRYGIPVHFKNEALKHCPIRASFSGTESLKEVMTVLCEVRNASYTITAQNGVEIDGEGCAPAP
jgi:ferric-dicitrate binding protein FerR (iron transport regulator)